MFKKLVLLVIIFLPCSVFPYLRDPTSPPAVGLQLRKIIISAEKKQVLIGDRYLSIGDVFGDAKILSITPHTVTLEGKNGKFTISMFARVMKKTVINGDKVREKNKLSYH